MVLVVALSGTATSPDPDALAPRSKLELFTHDAAGSAAFYGELGFAVVHEKDDAYTTLARGPLVIALSPIPWWLPAHWFGVLRGPPLGTEIVLYVRALEPVRQRLLEASYDPGEIRLQPWGDRDFRIRDPDGYYVRVSEGSAIPETGERKDVSSSGTPHGDADRS